MELKYRNRTICRSRCNGFNRTFMELKFRCLVKFEVVEIRFNRTFMELKSKQINILHKHLKCFNRTFMELK